MTSSGTEVHTTCGQPVGRLPQRHIWHELDVVERRWCSACGLNTNRWHVVGQPAHGHPYGAGCSTACPAYLDSTRGVQHRATARETAPTTSL